MIKMIILSFSFTTYKYHIKLKLFAIYYKKTIVFSLIIFTKKNFQLIFDNAHIFKSILICHNTIARNLLNIKYLYSKYYQWFN